MTESYSSLAATTFARMRGGGGMFDVHEFGKRVRRSLDGNYSYRKILVLLVIFGGFLLYVGPSLFQWLFSSRREPIEGKRYILYLFVII